MRDKGDRIAAVVLLAICAATRALTWSRFPGEPDSALFPVGLWRWITAGPLATRIYDRQFSAGYYWLAAELARGLHVGLAHYGELLNGISLAAALATAPLAYALARRYIGRAAAFWATVWFLLSPGLWWLGIEPHPQGLSTALLLASMLVFLGARGRPGAWGASAALLTASLLVRCDGFFFAAVFFLPWLLEKPRARRGWLPPALVWSGAGAAFVSLRALVLQSWRGAPAVEPTTASRIAGFIGHWQWAHQLLPFLAAAGVGVLLLALAGLFQPVWRAGEMRSWLAWIAVWAGPSAAFWLLVRGNNARHVALCALPLLWAGAEGWRRRRPLALPVLALAALAMDLFVFPPSSNMTLYPSGNVIASVRLLHTQQVAFQTLGESLAASVEAGRPECYLGSFTSPYVLLASLQKLGATATFSAREPVTRLAPAGAHRASLVFHDVYSGAEYQEVAASCRPAISAEYDTRGDRRWTLGSELGSVPGLRRWYARFTAGAEPRLK